MDIVKFVQNVKFFCERSNVKPTVACRESGAGKSLIDQMERRGSIPSVEKVQLLAQYLGITVSELLGECSNPTLVSDLNTGPPGISAEERELVAAYRRADEDDKTAIRLILKKYKKETATGNKMA